MVSPIWKTVGNLRQNGAHLSGRRDDNRCSGGSLLCRNFFHSRESDAETRQIKANIQSIYDHLPPDGRLQIAIRGANHFLFSDDGALLKSHIVMRMLRGLGVVGIDGRRQLAVTAYCVHSFFDAYLKGGRVSPLKISSPLYPEIQVLE